MRPVGGAHPAVCVGPNVHDSDRDTILSKMHRLSDETLNRGPDTLWSLKFP